MRLLFVLLAHRPGLPSFAAAVPALCILAATVGVLLIATCLKVLFRSHLIGHGGERIVRRALARLGLAALHDVVLADTLGHTQIDHLVRTSQGIAVFKTKTLTGWISGKAHGAQWTQHLAGGRVRHAFQNPVRQNYRHCKAVEAAIGSVAVPVRGFVVSAGRARFCPELETAVVPVAELGRITTADFQAGPVAAGELEAAWARVVACAAETPKLRRLHLAEVLAKRTPEQVLAVRMAWGLLPVGVAAVLTGLVPLVL